MSVIHEARSPRWMGNPRSYQLEAQRVYCIHFGRQVNPWSWVTTACDLVDCLDPECMTIHAPTVLAYPASICTYCGQPSGTKDHLLPRPMTGDAQRRLVAVVPACANCNSRVSDYPWPHVGRRREVAHKSILRTHRNLLAVPDKTPEDLRELGPGMRSVALKNNHRRIVVRARLAWPEDPYYDLRAFQKSGIEDPVTLGLCDAIVAPIEVEIA